MYGQDQHNEKLLGQVLREGDNRKKVTLVTKWGIKKSAEGKLLPDGECILQRSCNPLDQRTRTDGDQARAAFAGSPEFAQECIDQSIENLGSAPDIWLLHRIDANTPVEQSVRAMEEVRKAGKCRFIGLSAVSLDWQGREQRRFLTLCDVRR